MMSAWQQQVSRNGRRLRPEPKRPGRTSFLLFIKTQITSIALLPPFFQCCWNPEEIYSSPPPPPPLPATDWDSSVKRPALYQNVPVRFWALYGSERAARRSDQIPLES